MPAANVNPQPAISVLMSVYNTPAAFLHEALESILAQTFTNFEFVIVDDGSTDDATVETLSEYAAEDTRIKVLRLAENTGLTKALNYGLSACTGRYIARMDADDIAMPERLEKQLAFMESNPKVDVCGTAVHILGQPRGVEYATDHWELFYNFLHFRMPFMAHPTVMFRRTVVPANTKLYDETIAVAQDYVLWNSLLSKGFVFSNLKEPLLKYRVHQTNISQTRQQEQQQVKQQVREQRYAQLLQRPLSEQEKNLILPTTLPVNKEEWSRFVKNVIAVTPVKHRALVQQKLNLFASEKIIHTGFKFFCFCSQRNSPPADISLLLPVFGLRACCIALLFLIQQKLKRVWFFIANKSCIIKQITIKRNYK